jgi:hypothetical protein
MYGSKERNTAEVKILVFWHVMQSELVEIY